MDWWSEHLVYHTGEIEVSEKVLKRGMKREIKKRPEIKKFAPQSLKERCLHSVIIYRLRLVTLPVELRELVVNRRKRREPSEKKKAKEVVAKYAIAHKCIYHAAYISAWIGHASAKRKKLLYNHKDYMLLINGNCDHKTCRLSKDMDTRLNFWHPDYHLSRSLVSF